MTGLVYLFSGWLLDPKNEGKVHSLLDELDRDVLLDDSMSVNEVMKELEQLGETLLIEKIKNKEIPFGP